MTLHDRLERAKRAAAFGAKTGALAVGLAGTVALLGLLWVLLHDEERAWLEALAGEEP